LGEKGHLQEERTLATGQIEQLKLVVIAYFSLLLNLKSELVIK